MGEKEEIVARIEKDIALFYSNFAKVKAEGGAKRVAELSEMYARDSKSYLDKGDYYTSFSCISYAHGLLDALLAIEGEENVH
jgi:hypothetical protein